MTNTTESTQNSSPPTVYIVQKREAHTGHVSVVSVYEPETVAADAADAPQQTAPSAGTAQIEEHPLHTSRTGGSE